MRIPLSSEGARVAPKMHRVRHAGVIAVLPLLFLSGSFGFLNITSLFEKITSTRSESLLAQAGGARKPTEAVRVIQVENKPRIAELRSLFANEKQVPASQCISKEVLDRYYEGNIDKYDQKLAKDARCYSGYMEATVLDAKIANANTSITVLDDLLDLATKTRAALVKNKTVDGIQLLAIPAGASVITAIENATNIKMQCLKRDDVLLYSSTAIGKGGVVSDAAYVYATEKHKVTFGKIQAGIKNLNKKIQDEEDRLKNAEIDEDGKAIDKITGKPIEGPGISELMAQAKAVIGAIKGDFLPVHADLLIKRKDLTAAGELGISVTLAKDKNGGLILDNPARWITTMIHAFSMIPFDDLGTVSRPYYDGSVSISAGEEAFSLKINGKTVVPVPEPSIYADMIATIDDKIKALGKEKAKFQANLKDAQARLLALEKKSYYCQ